MFRDRDIEAERARQKYASFERERRWLVDKARRPDCSGQPVVRIEDRYLDGSRFRLRRMSRQGDAWASCKLTKKYDANDASIRPIVTAYLTEAEYALFLALPGNDIAKNRHRLEIGGRAWSLDIFEGALAGLELVESEAADDDTLAGMTPPDWVVREVTHDPRYQCSELARTRQIPEE